MASYTSNYQLHQWVPGDNFLRTDFNEDFAKIDAAIKGVETAANTALAKKSEFILGTYEGNGTTLPVNLGFKPRLVVITAGILSLWWALTPSTKTRMSRPAASPLFGHLATTARLMSAA